MKRYLHIGGSKDGQMLEVISPTACIHYDALESAYPVDDKVCSGMEAMEAVVSYDTYELYTLATSEKSGTAIYVWTGITLQQAMALLVLNYIKMFELKRNWGRM